MRAPYFATRLRVCRRPAHWESRDGPLALGDRLKIRCRKPADDLSDALHTDRLDVIDDSSLTVLGQCTVIRSNAATAAVRRAAMAALRSARCLTMNGFADLLFVNRYHLVGESAGAL
jgi:hypothetical protein